MTGEAFVACLKAAGEGELPLEGVVVEGPVNLRGVEVPRQLNLVGARFLGPVNATKAIFHGSFNATGARFEAPVIFSEWDSSTLPLWGLLRYDTFASIMMILGWNNVPLLLAIWSGLLKRIN